MKKLLPYLILLIVVVLVVVLIAGSHNERERHRDDRVTLREKDQIPYGTSAAKSFLTSLFPHSYIVNDDRAPGDWSSINARQQNQAVFFMSAYFTADESELNDILTFARNGNYVFITARTFSPAATRFFGVSYNEHLFDYFEDVNDDSLRLKLEPPAFPSDRVYIYPGRKFDNYLTFLDTAHTQVLGRNADGWPNFVSFSVGTGKIFLHTAPMAFSNYFILHKDNIGYFQSALSVLPKDVEFLVWDEYYLNKPTRNNEKEPNPFAVLMRYPGLKWGLLLGIFFLILLLLLGSRRRQRKIAPHEKPTNDSLDFVKTMGRLYYDRHDHQNLAKKMSVYFLEHVRTTYKLPTHTLDSDFVRTLHYKSGYPVEKLEELLYVVRGLKEGVSMNEQQLAKFHQQLELFYQNT
jgi:hypothetical protein